MTATGTIGDETRYLIPFTEEHHIVVSTDHGDLKLTCGCGATVPLPGLMPLSELMTWAGKHVGRLDPEIEMTVVIEHPKEGTS